ncbi:MAG: hypothetical protein AB7V19_02120 [Candidatus Bipolaricaulia bacterium]
MRVGVPVDAFVSYRAGRTFRVLRAIMWNGRRIGFETLGAVERHGGALLYRFDEGFTWFSLRLDLAKLTWYLEGIDDSNVTDFPPARCFAPVRLHSSHRRTERS